MRRIYLGWRTAACAAALLAAAGLAWADEPPAVMAQPAGADTTASKDAPALNATDTADKWRVEATAWVWLTALTGDIGIRNQTAHVDASFSDIVDASNSIFAFSGRLEVGKGSWAGYIDGLYADIGADNQTGPLGVSDVNVTVTLSIVDFGAMYRLGDWEPSGDAAKNGRHTTLDLYGGGRYTYLKLELEPARLSTQARSVDWVDPIVGAKLVLPFAEHWHMSANGDIGGFGVGSEFCWSATAVAAYDFRLFDHPSSIYAGYRAIGEDYQKEGANNFSWDMIVHGPILGFGMSF